MAKQGTFLQIQTILWEKPEVADFSKVADVLGTSREELESKRKFLRHLQANLSTGKAFVTRPHLRKSAIFPVFSTTI